MNKIEKAQKELHYHGIDGWLLYDFHRSNPLALYFLEIPEEILMTRRCFYWIPQKGEPVKILHKIEEHNLDHFIGETRSYSTWKEMNQELERLLQGAKQVAMEYSPNHAIPSISKVDGGLIDLIRSFGPQVVSSASFLQVFTCLWDDRQYQLHKEASLVLEKAVDLAWNFIGDKIRKGEKITEYDVQCLILDVFEKEECVTEGKPICGVNEHSADPHYIPQEKNSSSIKKGDFILIDLWCKKKCQGAVFADITRVGVADTSPTAMQKEIFNLVRKAQKEGTDLIIDRYKKGEEVQGAEVDAKVRNVIEEGGYGDYFTHRTGHNIHIENHGPGAYLDSLETQDDRLLIPKTCFSIEPGIYLPGKFGVRLEYDVFIHENNEIEVTLPPQEEILFLF